MSADVHSAQKTFYNFPQKKCDSRMRLRSVHMTSYKHAALPFVVNTRVNVQFRCIFMETNLMRDFST